MKDHLRALKHGFINLLPVLDGAGRAIMYSDSSLYKDWNPRTDEVRYYAVWSVVSIMFISLRSHDPNSL